MVRKKRQREQLESQDSATATNPSTTTTKLSEKELDAKQGIIQDPNGAAPTLHCIIPPSEMQCQPPKYVENVDVCYTPSSNITFPPNIQHNHPGVPTQLNLSQQSNQQVHSQDILDKNFLTPSSIATMSVDQSEAGKMASNGNITINNNYDTPVVRVETTDSQTGAVDLNSFNQTAGINDSQQLCSMLSGSSDMSSKLDLLDF